MVQFSQLTRSIRFLWVKLQLQNLIEKHPKFEKDVRNQLQDAPQGIEELYMNVLHQLESSGSTSWSKAIAVLKWLLCARRPLGRSAMLEALSLDEDGDWDILTEEQVLEICCDLVVADDKTDTFRFAHLSVQEFLERMPEFQSSQIHAFAVQRCLQEFGRDAARETGEQSRIQSESFRAYAVAHWDYHLSGVSEQDRVGALEVTVSDFLLDEDSFTAFSKEALSSTERHQFDGDGIDLTADPPTPLFAFCIFGLRSIMERWLNTTVLDQNQIDWNQKNHRGTTALGIASLHGHSTIVKYLLACQNIRPNERGGTGFTPLHMAVGPRGSPHVVEMLLTSGLVNIDAKDAFNRSAPHSAAMFDNAECVNLLLLHGIDMEALAEGGETALLFAAYFDSSVVMQQLLTAGADITRTNSHGLNALHMAMRSKKERCEELTRILLRTKIDVKARTDFEETVLHYALSSGSKSVVKLLLQKGADVNAEDMDGNTPLIYAAGAKQIAIVDQLLKAGAIPTSNGTELPRAIAAGCNAELVELLLDFHADFKAVDQAGLSMNFPPSKMVHNDSLVAALHYAARRGQDADTVKVVRTLLEAGADPDSEDFQGLSTLHHAAFGGSPVVAELFLTNGIKVDAQDSSGLTALALACSRGHYDFAHFLVDRCHADATIVDQNRQTMLHHAVAGGSNGIVRKILDEDVIDILAMNCHGYSALELAVERYSLPIIQMLLDKGAAAQRSMNCHWTPLHRASSLGFPQQYALMESLIEAGFDVNTPDNKKHTPLHLVQSYSKGEDIERVTTVLLDNGADPDARDRFDQTPLFLQCHSEDKNEAVIRALLGRGANANARNIRGDAPLHGVVCGYYPVLVKLLLAHGALPTLVDCNGWSPIHYAVAHQPVAADLLLDYCTDVDVKSNTGETALTFACQVDNTRIMRRLLDKGANALDTNDEGMTPLHIACMPWVNEDIALQLLKSKSVNTVDVFWNNMTPLMHAAFNGKLRTLEAILARDDANADQANHDHETALLIAAGRGQDKIVQRLLREETVNATHQDIHGSTALHAASRNGQQGTVQTLLDQVPSILNSQTELGDTALASACGSGFQDIVALLLSEEKVDVNLGAGQVIYPLFLAAAEGYHGIVKMLLKQESIDVLALGTTLNTILSISCELGWIDVFEDVWERPGVQDVAVRSDNELVHTPLHLAAQWGQTDIVQRLLRCKEVKIDASDNLDRTPLWYAAAGGHTKCMHTLLDHGAQTNLCDKDGHTPLVLAVNGGHITSMKLLLELGIRADIDFALERALMRREFAIAAVLRKAGATEIYDFLGLQRLFDPDCSVEITAAPPCVGLFQCYWL